MTVPTILVVGSGSMALEAAREVVAQGGRAILVRSGNVPRQCSLRTPGGFEVLEGELLGISGSPGRFRATLSSDGEEMVVECSAVVLAPGSEERPSVPGKLSLDDLEGMDTPQDLGAAAFVLLPGSPRRSFIRALRAARGLRSGPARPAVMVFADEMAAYGTDEMTYCQAQAEGVIFVRTSEPEVALDPLQVMARDLITGQVVVATPDLLVVEEGSEGGADVIRALPGSFAVQTGLPSMGVVSTVWEGISSPGPGSERLDKEAITGARAAATRAMTIALQPPDRASHAAIVDRDRCAACLTCSRVCPFGAAHPSEEGKASIDGELCQACGICVGACPARALSLPSYGDMVAEGKGLPMEEHL